jgi:hypothetical protein
LCAHSSSTSEAEITDKPLLELGNLHSSIENISIKQVLEELEKMERLLGINTRDHE